jgi:putative nucleotidyltransferase with HDIG domain
MAQRKPNRLFVQQTSARAWLVVGQSASPRSRGERERDAITRTHLRDIAQFEAIRRADRNGMRRDTPTGPLVIPKSTLRAALLRSYLPGIIAAGTAAILLSLWQVSSGPTDERWLVLAVLTLLCVSATLRIPGTTATFSISDSFTMASALLFGPAAATITVAIDGLVISARLSLARRKFVLRRVLYNGTAPPFAMWLAAHTFYFLVGADPSTLATRAVWELVLPLTAFAALFFVLNTAFIAGAIALEQRASIVTIWREHFSGLWLTYFGGAAVAALFLVLVKGQNSEFLGLVLVAPIPLIIYATFRNAVGRMEDRLGHLDRVNQMYLSTIEALAHAIDAKDQVTHGHLRRVQRYAIALANALGINDQLELRALEAAALLHDIGKIGVPDHILNKPSTLTASEREKMNRHANIGADILASIGFPFPVVPIVRHHHESWDGTGYPAGLAGDAIPIGARILAVVDCFDALISDRPYRRRLSQEDAVRILEARSGTMYDPHVVKTFLEIYQQVSAELPTPLSVDVLSNINTAQVDLPRPLSSPYEPETLGALLDLGLDLAKASNAHEAVHHVQMILRRLIPADTSAVYLHKREADALIAAYVDGAHADTIRGTLVHHGEGLTGWVAANRQTIANADPALDLGSQSALLDPPLQTCLSVPICAYGDVIGVLTIHSLRQQPFTEAHTLIAQAVATSLGRVLPTWNTPASLRARPVQPLGRIAVH